MTPEEREKMVDRLLDQALASYSQAEPRPGFEERILANLRTQPAKRAGWVWVALTAAAAAMVLVAAGLYVANRTRPAVAPAQVGKHAPAVLPGAPSAVGAPRAVAKVQPRPRPGREIARAHAQRAEAPRLAVFPAPSALSPQEQLLLALARRQPQEVRLIAVAQEAQAERMRKFAEGGVMPPPDDSITTWQ